MKSRKRTGPSKFAVVTLFLVATGGLIGFASYVKFAPADRIPLEKASADGQERMLGGKKGHTSIPSPKFDEQGNLRFDKEREKTPEGAEPKAYAVNAFLKKSNIFTADFQVEKVIVDQRVAMVYMPDSDMSLGSQDEATFLLGLRSALGQFGDIDFVELYIGGQKVDALGHEELDNPMPVIRPEHWTKPTKPSEEQGTSPSN